MPSKSPEQHRLMESVPDELQKKRIFQQALDARIQFLQSAIQTGRQFDQENEQ
jgi:hypothetical protein